MILSELTDETLVSLSLIGNDSAYEELVRRYQRAVIGAAYNILGDYALAEDAAQDAFVTAWIKLDRLCDTSRYGGWVCRISKNRARDMRTRHHEWTDLTLIENLEADASALPDELIIGAEENAELRRLVDKLPEKIRTVIHMHYYEGLSVAEIAYRLNIPDGTVKWRLSDGRTRLGKEYGIMTEKEKEFVKRVMKKVEELKLWQLRANKNGFEDEYRILLSDIDKIPESKEKYHAMADVLKLGYWWLPGEKNDETVARIREAAERSHNEEVMCFLLATDHESLSGKAKIEYIRDKQIPKLEADGYKNALGYAWFWLGCEYHRINKLDLAREAFNKVVNVSEKDFIYVANARSALRALDFEHPQQEGLYRVWPYSEEYRYIDGKLRFWSQPGYNDGAGPSSMTHLASFTNYMASKCDHYFFDEALSVGEHIRGSDGTVLTFVSDSENVTTPCGEFEACQLWRVTDDKGLHIDTYYSRGVGIVRQVGTGKHEYDHILSAYSVTGDGLLPFVAGNRWEYQLIGLEKGIDYECIHEVEYADDKKVTMAMYHSLKRSSWDDDNFDNMMRAIRTSYYYYEEGDDDPDGHVVDMSHYMERAEALAATAFEKAHAASACSAMRRIYDTCRKGEGKTATGHWNFFQYLDVTKNDGKYDVSRDYRYSFEWKNLGKPYIQTGGALLHNDVYGIISDDVQCVWDETWEVGTDTVIEYDWYRETKIKTHITVTDAGELTTAAGTFKDCICVTLDTEGFTGGFGYRGGKHIYYFAKGIGIIRMTKERVQGDILCDLTAYTGTGEGMFPLGDGFMRRYDLLGLTDGWEGGVVYTYAKKDGKFVIFSDQTGIKHI
ncbi:MAG: RNA polymerase sigma factor [Clostridia bacterium]|nr:RNA polymerase sigma factor [Clostridia bacterium]